MQPGQWLIAHVVVLTTLFWITSRKFAPFYEGVNLEAQRPWARRSKTVLILGLVLIVAIDILSNFVGLPHPTKPILILIVYSLTVVTVSWLAFQWRKAGDEFIRTVHTEALALGFVLAAVGILLLEGLVRAEILPVLGSREIGLTMGYALMISRMVVYLKYR